MTIDLAQKKCQPCEGIGQALTSEKVAELLKETLDWQADNNGKSIFRNFLMKNFLAAVEFINAIARIAEAENHHPDIHLTGYRKLRVELSTHALDGLSENDFILAAKINQLPGKFKT